MKRCDDCRYRSEPEYDKPCIVYREDCPLYQKVGDGMTKEEIIKELSEMRTDPWTDNRQMEALDMAIKALEQEPCEKVAQERYEDLCEYFGGVKDILKSRKDFKAWLERVKWHIHKAEELYEKYEYKKEPKTGHWIKSKDQYGNFHYECSECGNDIATQSDYSGDNYCLECGADMRGDTE